jgi:divalent metal cation (Fe/Co/Zn/Cd) transporter
VKDKRSSGNFLFSVLKGKDPGFIKYISLAGQLGLVMISSILIWFLSAQYLIKKFSLNPLWIAAATILGVLTGMIACYKLLKKILD